MDLDTQYVERCISTLEKAYQLLIKANKAEIEYDMYQSACVKEFEIIIEQCGKLLKKALKPYFHSSKAVDKLVFKDLFRHAAQHSIIDADTCERWLVYRDNRNTTAHDYGEDFAEETVNLLAPFIKDAKCLITAIQSQN